MAMLQINADWRIESDPYNWILQKRFIAGDKAKEENFGKETWRNEAYYSTVEAALHGFAERRIKVPDDIRGVVATQNEIHSLITELFGNITALQRV